MLLHACETWIGKASGLSLLLFPNCEASRTRACKAKHRMAASNVSTSTAGCNQGDQLDFATYLASYVGTANSSCSSSATAAATLRWQCYSGSEQLGVSLWHKTAALLRALLHSYPSKRIYLKLDSDTMVVPDSMLRFLTVARAHVPEGRRPLYVGSAKINIYRYMQTSGGSLLASAPWAALEQRMDGARAELARGSRTDGTGSVSVTTDGDRTRGDDQRLRLRAPADVPSYAMGGAFGFDRLAIGALVDSDCLQAVAGAVSIYINATSAPGTLPHPSPLFEDEAVGLCMHLHRIPLTTCACFVFDALWCNISDAAPCAVDSAASEMCRLPLTVHKLAAFGRVAAEAVYERWWRFVSSREPAALQELDAWEERSILVSNTTHRGHKRSG